MSTRHVADLMVVAHEGFVVAERAGDEKLRADALRVVEVALAHPDAAAFFGGVALALDELPYGNDPDVDAHGEGLLQPAPDAADEDSDAASPAYEGIVNGDNHDDAEKKSRRDVSDERPRDEGAELGAVRAAALNLARVAERAAEQGQGKLLVQVFKTREGAGKRCAFENRHSDTHRYSVVQTGDGKWQLRKTKR